MNNTKKRKIQEISGCSIGKVGSAISKRLQLVPVGEMSKLEEITKYKGITIKDVEK